MLNVGNRIGHLYRNSPNLKSFEAKLVASYRPTPKSIFGIFNPISVRRLFQLRVGLSPRLEHKNNHNFLDTPSNICTTCNSPENLEHFFLSLFIYFFIAYVLLTSGSIFMILLFYWIEIFFFLNLTRKEDSFCMVTNSLAMTLINLYLRQPWNVLMTLNVSRRNDLDRLRYNICILKVYRFPPLPSHTLYVLCWQFAWVTTHFPCAVRCCFIYNF